MIKNWQKLKQEFVQELKQTWQKLKRAIVRGSYFYDLMPGYLDSRERSVMAAFYFLCSIPLFFAFIPGFIFQKYIYEPFLKDLIDKHPIASFFVLIIPGAYAFVFYVIPVMLCMIAAAIVGGLLSFTAAPLIAGAWDKISPKSEAVATIDAFTRSVHYETVEVIRDQYTSSKTVSNAELFYLCIALTREQNFNGGLVDRAVLDLLEEALECITNGIRVENKTTEGAKAEVGVVNYANGSTSLSIKITDENNNDIPLLKLTTTQYDQLKDKNKYEAAARIILAPKPEQEKGRKMPMRAD
ncbi:MAG TPA: hypothetical protein VI522_00880 [Gammaproteobacteria bacterium]|nr:hypothetical protein [Gammaproteobacteria bacterium]